MVCARSHLDTLAPSIDLSDLKALHECPACVRTSAANNGTHLPALHLFRISHSHPNAFQLSILKAATLNRIDESKRQGHITSTAFWTGRAISTNMTGL